ncbi:26S proteasome non-ATPase regulatory subunit 4 [Octopus bimaculoides]|uniref:26S proteasome non-ATPase regulatory subunit 4 n=1 Tax=Octopus bimaculoides TaxID=37653 RepID=A0A0L8GFT9_OCTBM|nr:26S proteasome non-ATPase regulatory subunit 4 [Octopus bimaculoides]|eukprot:XP_014781403.1 PREDICTED: 26S proteasome non-ATPase regulatory subunit 4-like [Octopus bimaculoides]
MVIESTMVCVDNSDYMRNGDYTPTRLHAQQDAVNVVCLSKTRSNPENNVGLLVMSDVKVLVTLTTDVGRILSKLHQVQPNGYIKFGTAIRVAHLALKHRQGRNHKMRIVIFVASPIEDDEKELVKIGKKLKKEKVNVDVVNFGEEAINTEKLTALINTINGKDGTSSHLLTVPSGPMLSDALSSSAIVVGEDGAAPGLNIVSYEFGVDPNEDPELALALRVSMEEQRARQEDEARKAASAPIQDTEMQSAETTATTDEALLERALKMSVIENENPASGGSAFPSAAATKTVSDFPAVPAANIVPDISSMSEEEQIAYAMQMSLQNPGVTDVDAPSPMETAGYESEKKAEEDDYSEVMNDPAFVQSVLENLPGVDPESEAIRNAMTSLTKPEEDKKKEEKKDGKK